MSETNKGLTSSPEPEPLVWIVSARGPDQRPAQYVPVANQTIVEVAYLPPVPSALLETRGPDLHSAKSLSHGLRTTTPAFLYHSDDRLDANAAELAALSAWSGRPAARLPDGSVALSNGNFAHPRTLASLAEVAELVPAKQEKPAPSNVLLQHLANAELLSWRSWLFHPLRSASRAIPLRIKRQINQVTGAALFDLSFYVQFQPQFVQLEQQSPDVNAASFEPLRYSPKYSRGKQRVSVIIPQLGPGGAEAVLIDIVSSLDRGRCEILLLVTQSEDDRWRSRWAERVDHIYDLAQAVPASHMTGALFSIVTNWQCDVVIVQNTMYGYAVLPAIKRARPAIQTVDVVHAIDEQWNQVDLTAPFASSLDLRLTLSSKAQSALLATGTPEGRVKVLRASVPLERFTPAAVRNEAPRRIVYAGRLDAFKRPLLLVDIAARLRELRGSLDFQFAIAGDGPEKARFRAAIQKRKLGQAFDFLGLVDDLAPVYAGADVVILPSRTEGLPLVILEALASARPVVASNVGDIPGLLESCGVVIELAPGEVERYAESLNRLLNDPELRRSLGDAGRRKVTAGHDPQIASQHYKEILEQLLRRAGNNGRGERE
ncbi:MAG: glycosyltransferase family 4 protein [Bryobacteraceae bacterium]